jgi:hypothetical protein
LRKKVASFWDSTPQDKKNEIKNILLQCILAETKYVKHIIPVSLLTRISSLVRNAGARVVSAIAKIEVPEGHWNELLPFLYECCQHANKIHREVNDSLCRDFQRNVVLTANLQSGVYVIYSLLDILTDELMQEEFSRLFDLLSKTIMDVECKSVQIISLQYVPV